MQPNSDFTMDDLVRHTRTMQDELVKAQTGLADAEVVGTAGGGLVRVTMTAAGEVRAFRIDPTVVDPGDVHRLETLIMEALRDATISIRALAEDVLASIQRNFAYLERSQG